MKKTIRRILIVDDEFEFCKTIHRHLKRNGFLTEYALGGVEAYQKVQNSFNVGSPFDLVIIDIIMPQMDGVEIS
ncbi:MAG TPA: response regulator, partial [Anaerolineae bacterium]|nr:response regulator [Anaerolineae bacterium]